MSSAVAELETALQAMRGLKPPGASASRVNSLTALCFANVQSESVLIQKIYTHFKKTPGTHKLGVLYIVDSVTRKWMEQARALGQTINSSAQDGTFAAGVHRVTELMPVLMNDILSSVPEDQKERIWKLIGIWERGQTFPAKMIESFKAKLNVPLEPSSTTPPGSPPAQNPLAAIVDSSSDNKPTTTPVAAVPDIMETLAKIARQNQTAATPNNPNNPTPPPPAPAAAPSCSSAGTPSNAAFQQPPLPVPTPNPVPVPSTASSQQPAFPYYPSSQPGAQSTTPLPAASAPANPLASLSLALAQAQQPQQAASQPAQLLGQMMGQALNPSFPGMVGGPANSAFPAPAAGTGDAKLQQQLILIQTLAAQGIPIETISAVLAQVMGNTNAPGSVPPQSNMSQAAAPGYPPAHLASSSWDAGGHRPDDSRDRHGYPRSPNRVRGRSRSRSPHRHWDTRSPRSHGPERGYDYGDRDRDRNRGSSDYRQRSPQGRSDSPPRREKWVEYDHTLPNGCIRVLSRTLFVGGVTCSEPELRAIFNRHGHVQTCIVNKDKRHAFVKMYFRKDAVHAKEAMEDARNQDLPLRTRWGVGFGPRDCSDYSSGISVIPIQKLTEADRKWMLTAEYGGSGGQQIASGLCVEEPDIEIGAGVSSKAISRRMQTDKGGNHGPKSSRREDEENHSGGARWRRGGRPDNHTDNRESRRDDVRGTNEPPMVPSFPFGISVGANGMPVFPPGFSFPAPDGQQK